MKANMFGYLLSGLLLIGLVSCNRASQNSDDKKLDSSDLVQVDSGQTEIVSYPIILPATQIPGTIDDSLVAHLPAHVKAVAAFYSAMGGTDCDGETCKLTSALALGKQGSEQHKALIAEYFPGDKVAEAVLAQDCYLRPSGATSFTEFAYLTIRDYGDSLSVDYELFQYDRGQAERTQGPDTYSYEDGKFKNLTREIWTFVGTE